MHIAVGIFAHEANTFSPHPTGWDDFGGRQLERGDEMLADLSVAKNELSGGLRVLTAEKECLVTPLLAARAMSGGPVLQPVFEEILEELVSRLKEATPVDGVLMVLHGAMMAEETPDATGEILARVREAVGPDVVVAGTLDLHANVTARMVDNADVLVGYQTAPHIDMYQAGRRAAELLLGTVRGEISPYMELVRLPMILPPRELDP